MKHRPSQDARGFSLIELLTVVGLIAMLSVFVMTAFNSIGRGGTMSRAGGDIAALLEQARTHAMAQNTYVWVGFHQISPDTLAAAVVASRSGDSAPAVTDAGASPSDVVQLGPVRRFPNIRMAVAPESAARSTVEASGQLSLQTAPILRFSVGTGAKQIPFSSHVIQFNPRGEARIAAGQMRKIVEIGLQLSANGAIRDPQNYAALQVGALSGSVTVFRP